MLRDAVLVADRALLNKFWVVIIEFLCYIHLGCDAEKQIQVFRLTSKTSAGIITNLPSEKKFTLITEAIRDEGTSYHYITKNERALLSPKLMLKLKNNKDLWDESKSWTTDAPYFFYRETQSAIKEMKIKKVTCVEMESSALYAFAKAKNKDVHLFCTLNQYDGATKR